MNIKVPHTTYSDFPPIYFMNLDKIEQEEIQKIENSMAQDIAEEEQKRSSSIVYLDNWTGPESANTFFIFSIIIGIICGVVTAFQWGGIFPVIFCPVVSVTIGWIAKHRSQQSTEKQTEKNDKIIDTNIGNIREKGKKSKEELSQEIRIMKDEYTKKFEDIANTVSIEKFAGSKLLEEKNIVNWIMDNFGRYIDMAQREKHIKNVEVVYQFNVFTDKITCSGGTFDFNIQRCPELTSAIEQTALAMAIATELKIRTVMTYPKDVKDKDAKVSVKYSYTQTNVQANLIYTAVNGNYEPVGSW